MVSKKWFVLLFLRSSLEKIWVCLNSGFLCIFWIWLPFFRRSFFWRSFFPGGYFSGTIFFEISVKRNTKLFQKIIMKKIELPTNIFKNENSTMLHTCNFSQLLFREFPQNSYNFKEPRLHVMTLVSLFDRFAHFCVLLSSVNVDKTRWASGESNELFTVGKVNRPIALLSQIAREHCEIEATKFWKKF